MKHRKLFRRVFALVLSLATSFIFSPFAVAASTEAAQQAAFDALPDNAIVCYMYGQPVYKYEVDENHIVHKEFNLNSNTRASGPTSTLPTQHRYELIRAGCTLVTTGYSQTENIYYMPKSDANNVCNMIANCTDVISLSYDIVFAYSGPVGKGLSTMVTAFSIGTLNSISDDISDLTNANKHVELCVTSTQYGQFCSVLEWNGYSCVRNNISQGSTTYTVNSVVCENHGVSVWS